MSKYNSKFDPQLANSMNPNNDAYWQAKGYPKRPDNWRKLSRSGEQFCSSKNRNDKRYDSVVGYPDCSFPLSKDDY